LILSRYLKLVLLMLLRTFRRWLFIVGQQKIASLAHLVQFKRFGFVLILEKLEHQNRSKLVKNIEISKKFRFVCS
jgi:hypothetical protein